MRKCHVQLFKRKGDLVLGCKTLCFGVNLYLVACSAIARTGVLQCGNVVFKGSSLFAADTSHYKLTRKATGFRAPFAGRPH